MKQRGFTLVELLLATAMFSFILLFVTAAFVQVSRAYNKGITVKRTQETSRAVTQELARAITSASSSLLSTNANIFIEDTASPKRLCVGDLKYGWNEGFRPSGTGPVSGREQYTNNNHFTLVRSTGTCNSPFVENQSVEFVDSSLTIRDIRIDDVIPGSVYNLCVVVSSNVSGDFAAGGTSCDNPPRCNPASGDTYCDVSRLETTVTLRY